MAVPAAAILERGAGTQWNPAVVAVALASLQAAPTITLGHAVASPV